MAGILELSGWEFKTTMILRALMNKVNIVQEQMGNVSTEIKF